MYCKIHYLCTLSNVRSVHWKWRQSTSRMAAEYIENANFPCKINKSIFFSFLSPQKNSRSVDRPVCVTPKKNSHQNGGVKKKEWACQGKKGGEFRSMVRNYDPTLDRIRNGIKWIIPEEWRRNYFRLDHDTPHLMNTTKIELNHDKNKIFEKNLLSFLGAAQTCEGTAAPSNPGMPSAMPASRAKGSRKMFSAPCPSILAIPPAVKGCATPSRSGPFGLAVPARRALLSSLDTDSVVGSRNDFCNR